MIQSLRKKFILTAMLSVFAVLLLIVGGINVLSYLDVIRNAELRMDFLRNDALQPPPVDAGEPGAAGETGVFPKPENAPDNLSQSDFSGGLFRRGGLNAEAHYDSRFFTVQLNAAGEPVSVNTGMIAAVDETQAETMAMETAAKKKTSGFYSAYRFRAEANDEGTLCTFLDCSRELNTFYAFLTASVLMSAAGLLLIFLLILFFSKMALRPAAESYEKQKRFITDASHEIKTPLAVIGAAAEVIELENGESEWTESIRHQISRLTSLTEKLVLLSRMDEESYRPETREFSLSDAVRETAQSFSPVAQDRGKTYEIETEDGILYTGDPDGIRQVVSLLIDNAMKYSDEAGSVRVSLRKNGRHPVLTVYNTVERIEKGDHKEFFERFYRADASRSSAGGHGIGLSVAAAIAERHRGRLTAESADGKSITFTLTL